MSSPGPLSHQYVNGIYIPAGLLIVGVAIIKKDWLPYAVALAAALGGWKAFINGVQDSVKFAESNFMANKYSSTQSAQAQ
jgi:cytochrome-b5 reductase